MAPGEKIEWVLSHATPIGQYKIQNADQVQNGLQTADWRIKRLFLVSSVILKFTKCQAVASLRSSFNNISIKNIVEYSLLGFSYILSLTKWPGHRLYHREKKLSKR